MKSKSGFSLAMASQPFWLNWSHNLSLVISMYSYVDMNIYSYIDAE